MLNRRLVLAATLAALASCAQPTPAPALSRSDQDEIDAIARYLDGLRRLEARFVQSGSFGDGAGIIWLDRPGRLRIDYAGPQSSVMVANDGRIVSFDRRTQAVTTTHVSSTPLAILLAPVITLGGDVTVSALAHAAGQTRVSLRKTAAPGQGSLILALDDQPMKLAAVTLIDARGHVLSMALTDLRVDPPLTPELFANPAPSS